MFAVNSPLFVSRVGWPRISEFTEIGVFCLLVCLLEHRLMGGKRESEGRNKERWRDGACLERVVVISSGF